MTKVDIFSGFLGAGKTTLIRKLIEEAYGDEKIVLIENEFGEIGVDKGFLKNTGIQINQMNAGCICCTLVGDFGKALNEVVEQYHPDRILIEPSGVGKLSDVIIAVQDLENEEIQLNGFTTVVDAKKAKMYLKNFGEFYVNQVEHASSIILSHVQGLSQEKIDQVIGLLREHNTEASIVTTDWKEISGKKILETMEQKKTLSAELDHIGNRKSTRRSTTMTMRSMITTMKNTAAAAITNITTTMTTKSTSIITTMTMNAAAVTTTIITTTTTVTMRTRYSMNSVLPPLTNTAESRLNLLWKPSRTKRNADRCSVPRVSWKAPTASGTSSITFRASRKCVRASRKLPA